MDHHQELSPRAFWRQQVRYGRGALRLHRTRARAERLQRSRFYLTLLRRGFAQGARTGALVALAQLATAVGMAREALDR